MVVHSFHSFATVCFVVFMVYTCHQLNKACFWFNTTPLSASASESCSKKKHWCTPVWQKQVFLYYKCMVEETLKGGSLLILNSDRISHHLFKKIYANVCSSHSRIFLLLVCKESAHVCFYIYWNSITFQTWTPDMGAIRHYFVLCTWSWRVVGCFTPDPTACDISNFHR